MDGAWVEPIGGTLAGSSPGMTGHCAKLARKGLARSARFSNAHRLVRDSDAVEHVGDLTVQAFEVAESPPQVRELDAGSLELLVVSRVSGRRNRLLGREWVRPGQHAWTVDGAGGAALPIAPVAAAPIGGATDSRKRAGREPPPVRGFGPGIACKARTVESYLSLSWRCWSRAAASSALSLFRAS